MIVSRSPVRLQVQLGLTEEMILTDETMMCKMMLFYCSKIPRTKNRIRKLHIFNFSTAAKQIWMVARETVPVVSEVADFGLLDGVRVARPFSSSLLECS